jgi:hypothetical protein
VSIAIMQLMFHQASAHFHHLFSGHNKIFLTNTIIKTNNYEPI